MSVLSMTGSGMIVIAISALLHYFGITIGNDQITTAINGIIQVAGVVMTIYGQVRRKDLTMGLIRKS